MTTIHVTCRAVVVSIFLVQLTLLLGAPAAAQPNLPPIEHGDIAVRLKAVAPDLAAPLYGINPPGDTNRLFVLEQNGLVLVMENGSLLPTPALNLQSIVAPPLNPASGFDERGLLGLAFHPGFFDSGSPGFRTLYTYHSEVLGSGPTYPVPTDGGGVNRYKNVIAEWKISATDPNVIDPTSRREVLSIGKDASNHNGGTIAFGPDGYLYAAPGDGGNRDDQGPGHIEPGGNAQNLSTPLGKVLRIDPLHPSLTTGSADAASSNGQYRVPADNPFQGAGQVPEIYAYGLRNPYRFSFDDRPGGSGDLILADVGQGSVEEINRIVRGGNYGWAVKEGTFLFDRDSGEVISDSPGSPGNMIDPIEGTMGFLQYDHDDGISITGGFVYRGSALPELVGKYVFGDLAIQGGPRIDGRLFYADLSTGEIKEFLLPQFPGHQLPDQLTVHGFGQDGNGELYAMATNTPPNGNGGVVYMFVPVPEPTTLGLLAIAAAACAARGRRHRGAATP